jgi:hypothetical protein
MLELQLRRGRIAVQCTRMRLGRELYGDVSSAVRVQRNSSWLHSLLQKLETALVEEGQCLLELQIPAQVTQLRWPQRRVPPRRSFSVCDWRQRTRWTRQRPRSLAGRMSRHSTRLCIFTSFPTRVTVWRNDVLVRGASSARSLSCQDINHCAKRAPLIAA